jgi:hypothetical protein
VSSWLCWQNVAARSCAGSAMTKRRSLSGGERAHRAIMPNCCMQIQYLLTDGVCGSWKAPCRIEFVYADVPAFSGVATWISFRPALLIARASM